MQQARIKERNGKNGRDYRNGKCPAKLKIVIKLRHWSLVITQKNMMGNWS